MKLPLSWLREYVDFDLEPQALADRLTARGFELQGMERIGEGWSAVVIGELLDVTRHPHADRLFLTRVRVGDGIPPLAIVCGASNIRAGQLVPVALPGAVLPGGRTIGVSRIQGAESQGMLCSGDELGLTADADGILILRDVPAGDPATGDGPAGNEPHVGLPLEQLLGDVVLDVDVKPNRGDALSLIGMAREVAAISGSRLRWPEISVPESGDATTDHVRVTVEQPGLCPRFVARYVDNLSVGPAPLGVQLRLAAAGMRPVSNIVDASNYVMLELGKPIHTFDAAAVAGGHVVVRAAQPGEQLETLDHLRRELTPEALLIADAEKALGIAGVMGGADSEVGEGTTAVIIESAVFDPVSIRRTAQRYSLRSEASLRFEKGQESRLARVGADRTAQLISRWAGGRAAVGAIDTHPEPEPLRRVVFRPARVSRLLGEDLSGSEMSELLAGVDIATEPAGDEDALVIIDGEREPRPAADEEGLEPALVAVVPAHRRDISIEADLAEEVIRLRGFETLTPRLPDTAMPAYRQDPRLLLDRVRDYLGARGLTEVWTNGLISNQQHVALGHAADDPQTIRIANPVAADHSELRRSLLPGLLRVLASNERQRRPDVAIFEIGALHSLVDGGPVEVDELGILLCGRWAAPSWSEPDREAGVDDVKGIVEWLLDMLGGAEPRYERTEVTPLVEHPGRTAAVLHGSVDAPIILGRVGELHPSYLRGADVAAPRVAFATMNFAALRRIRTTPVQLPALPRLPAVERDIAIVVPESTAHQVVATVVREAAGPLVDRLWLFDRYQGPPLGDDEVSLAYRLRFQPTDAPSAEGDVEAALAAVAEALRRRLGARIRGADGAAEIGPER